MIWRAFREARFKEVEVCGSGVQAQHFVIFILGFSVYFSKWKRTLCWIRRLPFNNYRKWLVLRWRKRKFQDRFLAFIDKIAIFIPSSKLTVSSTCENISVISWVLQILYWIIELTSSRNCWVILWTTWSVGEPPSGLRGMFHFLKVIFHITKTSILRSLIT